MRGYGLLRQVIKMLQRSNFFSGTLGLKNTLFNQSGGSGNFYQGDGGHEEHDEHESEQDEQEVFTQYQPIDPQTIDIIDTTDLMNS